MNGNVELESAKTILRRKGHIVYDAHIDGGIRGMVKVDRIERTRREVIAMAMATTGAPSPMLPEH